METKKKMVIVILFPILLILFAICNGFFLDSLVESIIEKTASWNLGICGLFTIVTGVAYFLSIQGLLKYYDKIDDKKKTLKWKLDKCMIPMFLVGFISALILITTRYNDARKIFLIIGFAIFPLLGIIATPNIVLYTLKEMKDWKKSLYEKDDLQIMKDTTDYYKINSPLECERKIYFRVLKNQLLMIAAVLLILTLIVLYSVHALKGMNPNDIRYLHNIKRVSAIKLAFLGRVVLFIVPIPIIAYCITVTVYKLIIIRNHEYIAYHAIVKMADGSAITIEKDGRLFSYKDYLCIGIDAKEINNTKGTLVFIPDDVLFIPDNEQQN